MRLVRVIAALILALIAGEALLRVLLEPRNAFGGFFKPLPYYQHPTLGVVFGPPNFRGTMVPQGEHREIWFALDDQGLRPVPARDGADASTILVLGGASQTFGFALADAETWPARMAAHLPGPVKVRMLSTPGAPVMMDWLGWRLGRGGTPHPSAIVLAINKGDTDFAIPAGPDPGKLALVDAMPEDRGAQTWLTAHSKLAKAFGAGTSEIAALVSDLFGRVLPNKIGRLLGKAPDTAPPAPDAGSNDTAREAAELRDFVAKLATETDPPGRVLVVTLPSIYLEADHFRPITAALPKSRPVIDLQAADGPKIATGDVYPDGHFRAPLADAIGAAVAAALCAPETAPAPRLAACD